MEARCYAFAGSGPARTASMIGAAKIIETNRCRIMTTNAEEYLHLNGFAIKSPDAVVVIGNNISDHREQQVVAYAHAQCAHVLVVGNVACEECETVVRVAPFIAELGECPRFWPAWWYCTCSPANCPVCPSKTRMPPTMWTSSM